MPYLYGQAVRSAQRRPSGGCARCSWISRRIVHVIPWIGSICSAILCCGSDLKRTVKCSIIWPEGTWYNLITGAEVSGGKWQKETHDYHSLPLMIRPNTVLALGNNDQKPDYDYVGWC